MPTILCTMKKNITRPVRKKNIERMPRNKYERLCMWSPGVLGTWGNWLCSINVDIANRVDVMLSARLISHITLTMIIDAEGGGEMFCEICCPLSGDNNL